MPLRRWTAWRCPRPREQSRQASAPRLFLGGSLTDRPRVLPRHMKQGARISTATAPWARRCCWPSSPRWRSAAGSQPWGRPTSTTAASIRPRRAAPSSRRPVRQPRPRSPSSKGDAYPDRPIQIIVGFPPGQASYIGAHVLAARVGEELNQTVIVENIAGAMSGSASTWHKRTARHRAPTPVQLKRIRTCWRCRPGTL